MQPIRVTVTIIMLLASMCGCQATVRVDDAPRLYDGFGGYARTVSTDSPETQRWFDQGIQLLYGFNHDEAIRSFRAAATADPECPMAWWGIAYASGLHINNPVMTESQSRQAWDAAQEALRVIEHGSAVEQSLVRAVAQRYAWPIPEDRLPLDEAYANAMGEAWRAFPDDPDVGALYAESLMNLQPWDLWTPDGAPKGRTLEIVAVLETTMRLRPDHPGANHFYIHTVEASDDPARAIPAADRLVGLVPGAGHLVHMPSHIYARVGRYAEASDANERAVAADRRYFAVAPAPDFYSLYFVHNLHFLAYSAMMEGRYETALRAARDLERDIPEEFLRDWTFIADGFMPVTYHVMIRFGRWNRHPRRARTHRVPLAQPRRAPLRARRRAERARASERCARRAGRVRDRRRRGPGGLGDRQQTGRTTCCRSLGACSPARSCFARVVTTRRSSVCARAWRSRSSSSTTSRRDGCSRCGTRSARC